MGYYSLVDKHPGPYPATMDSGREMYEADHITPLIDAQPRDDDPYWPWRQANLQILCPDCHKAKTAREATQRARRRERYKAPWLQMPGLEAA